MKSFTYGDEVWICFSRLCYCFPMFTHLNSLCHGSLRSSYCYNVLAWWGTSKNIKGGVPSLILLLITCGVSACSSCFREKGTNCFVEVFNMQKNAVSRCRRDMFTAPLLFRDLWATISTVSGPGHNAVCLEWNFVCLECGADPFSRLRFTSRIFLLLWNKIKRCKAARKLLKQAFHVHAGQAFRKC